MCRRGCGWGEFEAVMPICTLMGEPERPADGRYRCRSGETTRCEPAKRWFMLPILNYLVQLYEPGKEIIVDGFNKARLFGEQHGGIDLADGDGDSERRVLIWPEVGLSLVGSVVVAM